MEIKFTYDVQGFEISVYVWRTGKGRNDDPNLNINVGDREQLVLCSSVLAREV